MLDLPRERRPRRKTNKTHRKLIKRIDLRNGQLRGKPEGVPVRISSGAPQDVSVAIGQAIEDDFKGFNSAGLHGIKVVLIEYLGYVTELEAQADMARAAAKKAYQKRMKA